MTTPPEVSAKEWWSRRRPVYNVALVVAGIGAFFAYAAVLGTRCSGMPEVEITVFTMALQGLAYLILMAAANLLYNFGYWSERLIRPRNGENYRERLFIVGVAVLVALPFSVPVLVAISGCRL
jgi:hypothetical protein